jgi:NNP family nitrate/nitrite transporter-like MFS transporter
LTPQLTRPDSRRSKVFNFWSWGAPHQQAFQLSWISFIIAFFATFAAPPLLPVIRNNLDLTKADLSAAAVASVIGAAFSRILAGMVCDSLGPRAAHASLQLLTSTATFCMAAATNSTDFIVIRMCIGFSLATFVACQYWCSVMFNVRIVGTANAVAAGWGNAGAGFTHILMPYLYDGFKNLHAGVIAWRCCFLICGWAQVLIGLVILRFGSDLPDGDYAELRRAGAMAKPKGHRELWAACRNYRTWLLSLLYGYCFGVELTVDNNIAPYLVDQFGQSLSTAGLLAAVFGLSNIFARALGGVLSDVVAKRFGMRGRLWALWVVQSLGGVCAVMMFTAQYSLGWTMGIVALWSLFVPMACGASFGVAPFVTRRGLGAAYGIIGSGGNVGAAVTQALFFTSTGMTLAEGFRWMGEFSCALGRPVEAENILETDQPLITDHSLAGVMTLGVTTLLAFVHFPMWGSMFLKGNPDYLEEDYYNKDFTKAELEAGLNAVSSKFASESRSQRGWRGEAAAAAAAKAASSAA